MFIRSLPLHNRDNAGEESGIQRNQCSGAHALGGARGIRFIGVFQLKTRFIIHIFFGNFFSCYISPLFLNLDLGSKIMPCNNNLISIVIY